MKRLIPYVVAGAVAGGAMVSTGCLVGVRAGARVQVAEPELVYVGPGVWVIEDHHEPVFYHGNHYWLYRGGYWYRSSVHHSGWVRVRTVPPRVRRIHRPRAYVRYRAKPGVRRRHVPARHQPAVRDHRVKSRRAAPPVRTRDHRRSRPAHRKSAPPPKVHTRDHRKSKKPAKKKKKSKVRVRDHRKD